MLLARLLAVDAVAEAHASAPAHRWLLDLSVAAVVVPGNRGILRRALAELLANVRLHTAPGTTATARVSVAGDRAVIEVLTASSSPRGTVITVHLQSAAVIGYKAADEAADIELLRDAPSL